MPKWNDENFSTFSRFDLSYGSCANSSHGWWSNQPFTNRIGHYNPSVRIIDLGSHTTYIVYVNFIHKWRERQIFLRNFSWQFYLLSELLPEICWEEIAEEIFFVFCFDVWLGCSNPGFSCNKATHYLLDHGHYINKLLPKLYAQVEWWKFFNFFKVWPKSR